MLKDYGHVVKDDEETVKLAVRASEKTMDICEFLWALDITREAGEFPNLKIAYQSPCSMQHGQKINHQPVKLLQRFGFEVVPVPDAYACCGSAGTYNILQPEMAQKLGQIKNKNIESTQANVIASGNLGCMLQLRQYSELPVLHTVELLDWASGGPRPIELRKL